MHRELLKRTHGCRHIQESSPDNDNQIVIVLKHPWLILIWITKNISCNLGKLFLGIGIKLNILQTLNFNIIKMFFY